MGLPDRQRGDARVPRLRLHPEEVWAAAVGINRPTFRKWVERGGLKPGSREDRFVRALAQAEALLETLLVHQVVAQAKADAKMGRQRSRMEHSEDAPWVQLLKVGSAVLSSRPPAVLI
jgi:hypothetical protein